MLTGGLLGHRDSRPGRRVRSSAWYLLARERPCLRVAGDPVVERVGLRDQVRERPGRAVAAVAGRELRERRLAVVRQDLAGRGLDGGGRVRVLVVVPAVDLAVRGVAEVVVAATRVGALERGVGPGRDRLRPHRVRCPQRRHLPGDHALDVGVETEHVDRVATGGGARRAERAAVLATRGRRVERVIGWLPAANSASPGTVHPPRPGGASIAPALDRHRCRSGRGRRGRGLAADEAAPPRAGRVRTTTSSEVSSVSSTRILPVASPSSCPGSSARRSPARSARPRRGCGRRTARGPCRARCPRTAP